MAGDSQEPLRLGFQADALHSGSISFGRFETEALCWERRSSFSHNRYLEEVEKCSKPGSVTEKKAYFEAHFRRKALLAQNSLECQSAIDFPSSENEIKQNMGCKDDIENLNEDSQVTSYDEIPCHSVFEREFVTTEDEIDYSEISYYQSEGEYAFDTANDRDMICEHVMTEEACQGCGNSPLRNTEPKNEANQNHNGVGEATSSDISSKISNCLPSSSTAEKEVSSKQEQCPPPKAKFGSQIKLVKSKLMTSQPSVVRAKKNLSEASIVSAKKPSKMESDVSMRNRKQKQLSESAASTMISTRKTSKPEVSQSSKGKLHKSKSAKESATKKAVDSRPSTAEKVAPRAHQNASRSMHAVNSTKVFMKQNGSAFSFKSDERAERRKEYNMKLEEEMNAKETEMQQVQAEKQEKTEADIKQVRKSLSFKATPMPSFYTGTGQLPDKNKAVAKNGKPNKCQRKPSSPGIGATAVGSGQACFTTESVNTTHSLEASGITSYHPEIHSDNKAQTSNFAASNCHPSLAGDDVLARKEEHKKVKHTSLQKRRVSEGDKMNKGQKFEDEHKIGAERRKKGVLRRDIKSIDMHNSSRMSNLAVGVAS